MAIPIDAKLAVARKKASLVLCATEEALKKHIGLVKKRERISSIVALIELLRDDIKNADIRTIESHLEKINELTKGFSGRVLKKKKIG